MTYELMPGASNDPEGNCQREWRRSSAERLHAAAIHDLADRVLRDAEPSATERILLRDQRPEEKR